jgi:hypothetical protein
MRSKVQRVLRDVEVTGYASEGKALAKVDGKVVAEATYAAMILDR